MCLKYLIVELMVLSVPILQIHHSYTDGSIDLMKVRWLNLAKKTFVLTCYKIRLKALYLVSSVWVCVFEQF